MGIAAYNRGSRAISIQILREHGRYDGDWPESKPDPRPADWGEKALARATERARRIVSGNAKYGRTVSLEDLAEIVAAKARVGRETALAAARAALEEPKRIAVESERIRIAVDIGAEDSERAAVEEQAAVEEAEALRALG